MAFLGFCNVYAMRVNLSVAIVAMTTNKTVTNETGTYVLVGGVNILHDVISNKWKKNFEKFCFSQQNMIGVPTFKVSYLVLFFTVIF